MPWGQMHLLYPTLTCPDSPECPTPTAFPSPSLLLSSSGPWLEGLSRVLALQTLPYRVSWADLRPLSPKDRASGLLDFREVVPQGRQWLRQEPGLRRACELREA